MENTKYRPDQWVLIRINGVSNGSVLDMSNELRPCPFEGCEIIDKGEHNIFEHEGRHGLVMVRCEDCGFEVMKEVWQDRPMLDGALEALERIASYSEPVECQHGVQLRDIAQQALSKLKEAEG